MNEKRNIFRENWLKTDKTCECCGQVTKKQKGLTKQNIKKLFSFKFDMNELIMTIVIILVVLSAYAYKVDTQTCRDYVKEAKSEFVPAMVNNNNKLPNLTDVCFGETYKFTINDTSG